MTKKLPGEIRSEIAKGARYSVNATRSHRDVTREMNNRNDGMTKLRREDLGRGSRISSKK